MRSIEESEYAIETYDRPETEEFSEEFSLDETFSKGFRERSARHSKKFVALLIATLFLSASGIAVGAIFLFRQNAPPTAVLAALRGCTGNPGADEPIVQDTARGGTGVTFVCSGQTWAIEMLTAGAAQWHHDTIGGYTALYLILSVTTPVEGCHKVRFSDGTVSSVWAVNITPMDGTLSWVSTQSYAYCAEFTTFGSFSAFSVSWSQ